MSTYKTEQEKFWAESFGDDYIDRNKSAGLLASNLNFFSGALKQAGKITSCIEFGANIGMNLKALRLLYPEIHMSGVEINELACKELEKVIGPENVAHSSIFDVPTDKKFQVSIIKGVLIHINPEMLPTVYQKLYDSSEKFILIGEYYNPAPITIPYRGHQDRLFKRDFAGEFMDKYPDVKLIDYAFSYHRDPAFPQDDITWFLMSK